MTLTRFQIHERLGSLSGEVKAAHEQKRLTAETLAHQEREVTLARQADEKAEAQIVRLEQEALDLAAAYHETVKELIGIGGDAPAAEAPPVVLEAVTGHPAMTFSDAFYCEEHAVYHMDGDAPPACVERYQRPAFADFGHPTQNGLDVSAVNAAYDRSTHP